MSRLKAIQERSAKAASVIPESMAYRALEVDADSLIYKVAATTKGLETAKRRFVSEALTLHFLAGATLSNLHLTPKHCKKANRFNVIAVQKYQGNRDPKLDAEGNEIPAKKPELVEPLRYVVGRGQLELPPEFSIVFNDVYEADDSVVMACHADPDAVFYSEDKDLDCLGNKKLCQHSKIVLPAVPGLGWLAIKELSASKKVVGRGPVFFWAQMLMGDTADHITGITKANKKNCGAVATFTLLQEFLIPQSDSQTPHPVTATTTEYDIAKFVIQLYKDNNQNIWPEAWLLWLYRTEKYSFYAHVMSLGLFNDEDIGEWLKQQAKLEWFRKPETV